MYYNTPIKILKDFMKLYDTIYLIVNIKGITAGKIPLKGYAGTTGRLDEIARDFMAIHHPSSGGIAYLEGPPTPPLLLLYSPSKCNFQFKNERIIINEIRKIYQGKRSCVNSLSLDFRDLISQAIKEGYHIVLMSEKGKDLKIKSLKDKNLFLMGAHIDIPDKLMNQIRGLIHMKISIGPLSYQASQVIAYLEYVKEVCNL